MTQKTQILKLFLILMSMSLLCSCSNDEVQSIDQAIGSSEIYLYGISAITEQPHQRANDAELLLTGDDIQWFNPQTREIKFKGLNLNPKMFAPYTKIQFKLGDRTLFEAFAYVNMIYSQVFSDLVIFHDIEKDAYYLNDCYPDIEAVRNSEETKTNIKAREENWNRFLEVLRAEKKLK